VSLFETYFAHHGISTDGEVDHAALRKVLDGLNAECGTSYRMAWFHQAKQRPNRQLPTCVRRHMLATVLDGVLAKNWVEKLL
jgi:hypothetical protein